MLRVKENCACAFHCFIVKMTNIPSTHILLVVSYFLTSVPYPTWNPFLSPLNFSLLPISLLDAKFLFMTLSGHWNIKWRNADGERGDGSGKIFAFLMKGSSCPGATIPSYFRHFTLKGWQVRGKCHSFRNAGLDVVKPLNQCLLVRALQRNRTHRIYIDIDEEIYYRNWLMWL